MLDKINLILSNYKSIIETFGILTGLLLLFLTYKTVLISQSSLKFNQQKYYRELMPTWKFSINDLNNTITLMPNTSDVKLERADVFYPDEFFINNYKYEINPPQYSWNIESLKLFLKIDNDDTIHYDANYYSEGTRGKFPICINVSYTQLGEKRTATGLFIINYGLIETSAHNFKPSIIDILLVRYLNANENMQDILNTLCLQGGYKKLN